MKTILINKETPIIIDEIQYAWGKDSGVEPTNWQTAENGALVTTNGTGGSNYLFVKATDKSGNVTIAVSNDFNVGYEVKYNANGGTGTIARKRKGYESTLELSNGEGLTRLGYTLIGWSKSSETRIPDYSLGGNYTSDETAEIFAVWAPNTNTPYTVQFFTQANGTYSETPTSEETRTGTNAQAVAKQYGAKYATTDYDEILNDPNVDMVMICTRHNLHAEMSIKALKAGKAVFVEKPMALSEDETKQVLDTIQETGMPFMVGYNRRFSKYATEAKKHIEKRNNPLMIYYRMNAGFLPKEHWTQGPEGGGRIIGEGCHIIDLFNYFTDSKAESVSINQITPHSDKVMGEDNCVITIKYEEGSVCTLLYTGQGNNGISKEYCEIYCDGAVITIDDYKKINGYGVKVQDIKSTISEKGQKEEMEEFYKCIKDGQKYPIELWQLEQTSQISYINAY